MNALARFLPRIFERSAQLVQCRSVIARTIGWVKGNHGSAVPAWAIATRQNGLLSYVEASVVSVAGRIGEI